MTAAAAGPRQATGGLRWPRPALAAGLIFLAAAAAVAGFALTTGSQTTWPPAGLAPGTIATVVGSGEFGLGRLGSSAADAGLEVPVDLAFDGGGDLYVAERYNHRILRVDRSGAISVIAGTLGADGYAKQGFAGDGGPATEAKLSNASAVAVAPDGRLYISDSGNNRIRVVDAGGVITTVAGTGEAGFSGDGGPASRAAISNPLGLAFDRAGNLYFLDAGNFRIRSIDPGGTITTVAGTGEPGFSPDGTPARDVSLGDPSDHMPVGLAFDAQGQLLFADMGNNRIRMLDEGGRIRTVAGSDEPYYAGDGGPAGAAGVDQPLDVAVAADGTIYISTHGHGGEGNRIRRVAPGGVITTLAGIATNGYSGDGGPAAKAELDIPAGLAIGPDGNLYVADAVNNVVRMVVLR